MKENHIFVTVKELASLVAMVRYGIEFSFTFDTPEDIAVQGEPEGIYGIAIKSIFDEFDGVLCFGYYGGYCTRCIDMNLISEDTGNLNCNIVAINKQLNEWISSIASIEGIKTPIECLKVCLIIEDENKDLIIPKMELIKEKEQQGIISKMCISKYGWEQENENY